MTNQEMYSTKGYFDNLDTEHLLGWWIGSSYGEAEDRICREDIIEGVTTINEMKQWSHENEIPPEHFIQLAEALKILWAEAIGRDDDLALLVVGEHTKAFQDALMATLVGTYAFCAEHMFKEGVR